MKEEEIKKEIKKLENEIQAIKNNEWMVWVLFLGGLVFLFVMGLGLVMIILALLWHWDRSNKLKELTSKKERYENMLMDVGGSSFDERQKSMEKGHEFEKYVAYIFNLKSDYFAISNWNTDHSDKRDGIRVESDSNPDFLIRYKPTNEQFAVECKWRASTYYNQEIHDVVIKWADSYQIKNYQQYSKQHNVPVFIVIGLAGKPSNPKMTFCLPLEVAKYPEIFPSVLEQYERIPPNKPFFWRDGILK